MSYNIIKADEELTQDQDRDEFRDMQSRYSYALVPVKDQSKT